MASATFANVDLRGDLRVDEEVVAEGSAEVTEGAGVRGHLDSVVCG
jgi:hypothetical protein